MNMFNNLQNKNFDRYEQLSILLFACLLMLMPSIIWIPTHVILWTAQTLVCVLQITLDRTTKGSILFVQRPS